MPSTIPTASPAVYARLSALLEEAHTVAEEIPDLHEAIANSLEAAAALVSDEWWRRAGRPRPTLDPDLLPTLFRPPHLIAISRATRDLGTYEPGHPAFEAALERAFTPEIQEALSNARLVENAQGRRSDHVRVAALSQALARREGQEERP